MITDTFEIRPRYSEVDQMGYVYHANYVDYCHQARTELMRKLGVEDSIIEEQNLILPVISFEIKYKKPAGYDKPLSITTTIKEIPKIRLNFEFEIRNEKNQIISTAKSTIVFADKQTRLPVRVPEFVSCVLKEEFNNKLYMNN